MDIKKISKAIKVLLPAVSALFSMELMAQDLKKPTLEDLIPGGETYRTVENLHGLQWWGDVCIKPGIDSLFAVNPQNGKETLLTTREKVNRVLGSLISPTETETASAETETVSGAKGSKIQHFYNTEFPWHDKPYMLIKLPARYIIYDFEKDEFVKGMPQAGERNGANIDYTPQGGHIAYTVKNNLFVDNKAVTAEPEGIVCGQSVHRNEFGISKGTFWSPQGDRLAFYRMDESMVTQYPLVDITSRVASANPIRYPMAGMSGHQVTVGIYNTETQTTVYLNTGDPADRYFTNISWAPDGKSLYLIELNRDQNHSKLCQYDAETGEPMSTLLEETHPKYVEPQQPIVFLPWDSSKFIYQSQRDGYNHLYLVDTKIRMYPETHATPVGGGTCRQSYKVKQLTEGKWLVNAILGFNAQRKEVIFNAIDATGSANFAVNVNSGKRSLPFSINTDTDGVHTGLLSASGTYIIDSYSSPAVPRNIDIINTKTFKTVNLLRAKNPFEGFAMPGIETGTLKAADGKTNLYYRLVKPAGFDPNKKYPAIVYVYGGPHAQLVTNGWMNGARGWDLYMANKGYIMFTLDNRGSSNRGLKFENATFRQLGIEEGKDQVKGVEYLKSLPYVDGNRIGVHGWSFGGHMTTALMLRYPEIFKTGVAGGPVIDWSYYEVMYGERYMDTPQANPEGYKETNLRNLVGNLKGHLLIIHDDHDDTCVPQHTLSFMKACIDARTYPDLFIYPGHKHNVLGRDRVHLHEKITRYFEDYL